MPTPFMCHGCDGYTMNISGVCSNCEEKMMNNVSGNKPHTGISKRLSLCKKCNRVWEWEYQSKKVIHYESFPTYKLKRQICKECEDEMRKEEKIERKFIPYKGMDKKPVTEMSARKRRALENWSANHAKKKFKPRKSNEPTVKIPVGMEYKDES